MPLPRLLASIGLALACTLAFGCAAEPVDEEPAESTEAELGSDEESFASYDATDDELAGAEPGGAFANEMTLYAIPAPRLVGLKWRRPGGLARRTLISNGLGLSRSLGHAAVRIDCAAASGLPAGHFQGSVIATGDEFRDMVLKEKAGLGVLFRTVPGALEDEDDLQETIDQRYANGRISFVRFALSPEVCRGLLGYAEAFRAEDVGRAYGFVRPLYKEGAGCSAFSMAFLELARLDEARFRDAWSFDVRVPMSLIGGETNPGHAVSVLSLFLTLRPWAREDEPHMRLVGWDPTKMYTSIRTWAKTSLRTHDETVERRGRALGLVLDRRHVPPRPELSSRTYWAGNPHDPRNLWGFGDP